MSISSVLHPFALRLLLNAFDLESFMVAETATRISCVRVAGSHTVACRVFDLVLSGPGAIVSASFTPRCCADDVCLCVISMCWLCCSLRHSHAWMLHSIGCAGHL